MFMFKARNFKKSIAGQGGFTLIEITITLAIFGLLSTLVLANLRAGEKSRNLRIAADAMQSVLRQVQSSSLSGEAFATDPIVSARDFGWQTTANWGQSQTFKEQSGIASPYNKTVTENINFPNQVLIDSSSLTIDGNQVGSLEIRFFPPFGEIRISGGAYTEAKNVIAQFHIIYSGAALSRTVKVDGISGNISVQ
jgi:prepilin-type N-terminal cleavage/methylation domain-containing protein